MINNKFHFDVYHKTANSFSYLHYKGCHPPHTKNNIALSLARRILRIVTDNTKKPITALAGYPQNTSETVTKLNHIFKYSHSIMKQIQRLENIKENDTFLDGNLH